MFNNSSTPPVQLKYLAGIAWVNFIALISVFPFYIHVFQMNRERDKTTPVFPIINQIYKSIKMVYIQFAVTIFLGYAFDPTESRYFWVGCAAVVFEFCWMRIFCNVCYLLLILQAFQKFLIYFCPRIEKYVTLSERVVERIAHVLMFPIILFEMFHGSFSFVSFYFLESIESLKYVSVVLYYYSIIFIFVCIVIHSNRPKCPKNELFGIS